MMFASDPGGCLNVNSILLEQEDREFIVPLHSGDDVDDAITICLRLSGWVYEYLAR